ncbi:MAG TPA: hypothetical protein VGK59_19230 [Ohtaekwangia sp.]
MDQINSHTKISVAELRRLLFELRALRPEIGVRFRLIGELWQTHFYQIALLTEKGVALNNDQRKLTIISDLKNVMQFELEQVFQKFQPHFHYSIDLENSLSEDIVNPTPLL